MKEDMENLLKLQKIDAEIHRMVSSKEKIPKDIEDAQDLLAEEKALLEHENNQIEDTNKKRKILEGEIAIEEERIKRDKEKLTQVKSNTEYHALLREIDNSRREISDRETQILKLMEHLDDSKQKIEEINAKASTLEKELSEKKKELEEFLTNVDKNIDERKSQRKQYIEKINASLLAKYNMIKDRKEYANVLARIACNTCANCNMNLPPQMVNEVRAMTEVHMCPTCDRILYWSDEDEKED